MNCAVDGAQVAWIAPTHVNSRVMWRFLIKAIADEPRVKISLSTREARFPGGGRISLYTADNDAGIRGEAFHLAIMEEAAQIKEETWADVVMPTLADYGGKAYLISTPKGRNWYFREYLRGIADGKYQASFTAPSTDNPSPQIQRAAAMAKNIVSERTYRQEWLAEFVEDGSLFVNVEQISVAADAGYIEGHVYMIGVDWARSAGGDYTVYCVIDATTKTQCRIVRLNGEAFGVQLSKLKRLWREFGEPRIIAEYNSMGGPLIEKLQSEGLPVDGFVTTSASKHEVITNLELAFDNRELTLLNDETQKTELLAYEKKERSGIPSYSAPDGMHDDTVMALALCYYGINNNRIQVFL